MYAQTTNHRYSYVPGVGKPFTQMKNTTIFSVSSFAAVALRNQERWLNIVGNPCYNCPDDVRHIGCHSTCEAYRKWKQAHLEQKLIERELKREDQFFGKSSLHFFSY